MYPNTLQLDMQTTVRFPSDLLEDIDADLDPETSRSEWIRDACRQKLDDDELGQRISRLETRVEKLENNQITSFTDFLR